MHFQGQRRRIAPGQTGAPHRIRCAWPRNRHTVSRRDIADPRFGGGFCHRRSGLHLDRRLAALARRACTAVSLCPSRRDVVRGRRSPSGMGMPADTLGRSAKRVRTTRRIRRTLGRAPHLLRPSGMGVHDQLRASCDRIDHHAGTAATATNSSWPVREIKRNVSIDSTKIIPARRSRYSFPTISRSHLLLR